MISVIHKSDDTSFEEYMDHFQKKIYSALGIPKEYLGCCSGGRRMLVSKSGLDRLVEAIKDTTGKVPVGKPMFFYGVPIVIHSMVPEDEVWLADGGKMVVLRNVKTEDE